MNILLQSLGYTGITPIESHKYISVAKKEPDNINSRANITDGVASFYTNVIDTVKNLLVDIETQQSGSGEPSPDNIRPVSGWTGVTISHSGEDTSEPETLTLSWETEAGVIYGGSIDVTTGVLIVDCAYVLFNSASGWGFLAGNPANRASHSLASIKVTGKYYSDGLISNYISPAERPASIPPLWSMNISPSGGLAIGIPTSITSASEWGSYLEENPLELIYPIDTPITYQLTPLEVETLLGVNNIWADCGPILNAEY